MVRVEQVVKVEQMSVKTGKLLALCGAKRVTFWAVEEVPLKPMFPVAALGSLQVISMREQLDPSRAAIEISRGDSVSNMVIQFVAPPLPRWPHRPRIGANS
jgi:hypothetical protein